jgi:hypothetical protein
MISHILHLRVLKSSSVSLWITLALVLTAQTGHSTEMKSGYLVNPQLLCDGHHQIQVDTAPGTCVGIIASKAEGLKMPRYAAQSPDGTVYVTEMYGWAYGRGTIFALEIDKSTTPHTSKLTDLFPQKKLTMPNGIAIDPEGRIYVGTPQAIYRFNPKDINGQLALNPPLEIIANEFSKSIFRKDEFINAQTYNTMNSKLKNKHPLIQLTPNKNFTEIFVNVGAPSDDCQTGIKTTNPTGQCVQSESQLANAAVWKLSLTDDSKRTPISFLPYSRGLRNSMALTVHPISNQVVQGENGIDLSNENLPYEEINYLEEGQHYGWPYCHSDGQVAPGFVGKLNAKDCTTKFKVPRAFMPAHTAPLGLLFTTNKSILSLQNRLLVSWHGYQKNGQRVVAYPVDERGQLTSNKHEQIVFNWTALSGIRPKGAPTGLTQLHDGSILILDDKNGAVLRLASGDNTKLEEPDKTNDQFSAQALQNFEKLRPQLQKNCALCHQVFNGSDSAAMLSEMRNGMLNLEQPLESLIYIKLKNRLMPPEAIRSQLGFDEITQQKMLSDLEIFLNSL